MSFNISYTQPDGQTTGISIRTGDILFVLGANGTGKSSLMHQLYVQSQPNSRWICAHRANWLTSNMPDFTPSSKRSTEQHMVAADSNQEARYIDRFGAQRAHMTIFELLDAQNVRARSITAAVDASDLDTAVKRSLTEAPLATINTLLRMSNIPIKIDVIENEQMVASKNGGAPYSIAQLSDGERNALLIAGAVLTAKTGMMLLIDEPERHLHRSIISPLLSLLFKKRIDCAFVVATHDLNLPMDNEAARVLLIRSSVHEGPYARYWEADLLEPGASLDDEIKRDIIGSRRKILFIEGQESSLDKPLYSLIFPMISVIAKENCKAVEQAVMGLRSVNALAWVNAWGIIDGDGQSAERVADLEERGIFALPFYSVESIYYHPYVLEKVAIRLAKILGVDARVRYEAALDAGVCKVRQNLRHMVLKTSTRLVRDRFLDQLPTTQSVADGQPVSITIDTEAIVADKYKAYELYLNERDWTGIVTSCPVRESGALDAMARAIGYQNRTDYEAAVCTMLIEDEEALGFVRNLFGAAYTAVSA